MSNCPVSICPGEHMSVNPLAPPGKYSGIIFAAAATYLYFYNWINGKSQR